MRNIQPIFYPSQGLPVAPEPIVADFGQEAGYSLDWFPKKSYLFVMSISK